MYSHFEYQVMYFQLSKALSSFEGYINKILAKKLNIFIIVCLNDIFVYIKDLSQGYIKIMRWILDIL